MKDDNHTENAPCYLTIDVKDMQILNNNIQRDVILNNIFREIQSYQTSKEIHKHDNAQAYWNVHINFNKYFAFFEMVGRFALICVSFPLNIYRRSTKMMKTYTRACLNILAIDGNFYIDY